ncbi:MAG: lasso RiPP family leader peptide-containing protein [Solirubrobacteraceae bacterium]
MTRPGPTTSATGNPSPPLRPSWALPPAGPAPDAAYQPPALTVLGTLADLTRGGNVSTQSDGLGFAGGSGTI